jgi:hypothetical protein
VTARQRHLPDADRQCKQLAAGRGTPAIHLRVMCFLLMFKEKKRA